MNKVVTLLEVEVAGGCSKDVCLVYLGDHDSAGLFDVSFGLLAVSLEVETLIFLRSVVLVSISALRTCGDGTCESIRTREYRRLQLG